MSQGCFERRITTGRKELGVSVDTMIFVLGGVEEAISGKPAVLWSMYCPVCHGVKA